MLTEKVQGDDCTAMKYLEQPERLCDLLAERLALLHEAEDNHKAGLMQVSTEIQNFLLSEATRCDL